MIDYNSDLIIHRYTKEVVGYIDEQGLIKWKDNVKPDNIDLESLSSATAWVDAEGNIHKIERKVVESYNYSEVEEETSDTELTDMVEVRNVNFSIEQKLDKIIDLLEKLVPKPLIVNPAISVGKELTLGDKDFDAVKFNEALKGITNKIYRVKGVSPRVISKEEFVTRLQEIDVDKLVNGKWETRKVKPIMINPDNNEWWVFKKKDKEFIKVGTADFHEKENVVRINFLDSYKKEYIENPSIYEHGFWTITDYGGSNYLGYEKNLLNSYQFKYDFTEIEGSHGVTGYTNAEGKVIYYDQYI